MRDALPLGVRHPARLLAGQAVTPPSPLRKADQNAGDRGGGGAGDGSGRAPLVSHRVSSDVPTVQIHLLHFWPLHPSQVEDLCSVSDHGRSFLTLDLILLPWLAPSDPFSHAAEMSPLPSSLITQIHGIQP